MRPSDSCITGLAMVRMVRMMTTVMVVILIRTVLSTDVLRLVVLRPVALEPVVLTLDVLLDLVDELADIATILAHGLYMDSFRALHGRHGTINEPVGNSWLSLSWLQPGKGRNCTLMDIRRRVEVVRREVIVVRGVFHDVMPDRACTGDANN